MDLEEKILDTIRKSKEVFYMEEQKRMLTYTEFLWVQFKLVQKRWWLFQCLLLAAAGTILSAVLEEQYMKKSMGVTAVLFVVLVIPELWKNKNCGCMEIESASYYSLRQIYAARIFLFGIVDVFLLTVFCGMLHGSGRFTAAELLVQFLFPMTVTACICFSVFCGRNARSEVMSLAFCLIWSGVWWLLIVNERIYGAIVLPVWIILFGMAALFLAVVVHKTLRGCEECWEVNLSGIENN